MTNTPTMRNRLLRTACDRCHSQKLRCPRPSKADSEKGDKTCNRCRRAGKICVFSKRGKSGRPSKIVTAGAQLRSSFLAQPAESEISARGSTSPPENPPPDVSNTEAILDSATVQSDPGASMETSGSVRHSTEDIRTLSISDVPLPSCTLGQEAIPAPTVPSVSTSNSDYQPLGFETDSTQTLEEVTPDFPMAYNFGTCPGTRSVPTSQMSKSPSGLGSETWSEFLLSSNISYSNDIPNFGVQLHHTLDKQGSIFSNSNPAPSDLSSSGHYSFLDCGNAINPHPFGNVAGELSGLNYRITCALTNYKATAIIDDFDNLQLYQVVQDIIDISRQLIAITKQCLPYIPTTPDSSPASSPSSAMDELPEGSSRTSPAICKHPASPYPKPCPTCLTSSSR